MAINLGEAYLSIGGDARGFQKEVGRTQKTIKKRLVPSFKVAAIAAAGIGTAAVAAAAKSIKSFAQFGDQMQKMSIRIGFSAERLSELNYVADRSGTSIEAVEKASRRMSKTINDATEGMATYQRAFERLGLDAAELKSLKPEEAFLKIGRAIASMDNEVERVATMQDIFGRSGGDLAPMFADGVDGFNALIERSHNLNQTISGDSADAAAAFQDHMGDLGKALGGLSRRFGEGFVTEIGPDLRRFADWAASPAGREWGENMAAFGRGAANMVSEAATIAMALGNEDLKSEREKAGGGFWGALKGIGADVGSVFRGYGPETYAGRGLLGRVNRAMVRVPLAPLGMVASLSRSGAERGTREWWAEQGLGDSVTPMTPEVRRRVAHVNRTGEPMPMAPQGDRVSVQVQNINITKEMTGDMAIDLLQQALLPAARGYAQ